jgi:hypothetical protein
MPKPRQRFAWRRAGGSRRVSLAARRGGVAGEGAAFGRRRTRVHARALDDLVDDLHFRPQRDADNLRVVRPEFGERGAIGRVVSGREHLFDMAEVLTPRDNARRWTSPPGRWAALTAGSRA